MGRGPEMLSVGGDKTPGGVPCGRDRIPFDIRTPNEVSSELWMAYLIQENLQIEGPSKTLSSRGRQEGNKANAVRVSIEVVTQTAEIVFHQSVKGRFTPGNGI